MAKQTFMLNVNGKDYSVDIEPDEPLLWVLRDDLKLTGSKFGCGVGVCAANGNTTCSGGVEGDNCTPGDPTEPGTEVSCGDGLDNDCDGIARRSCCVQVANVAQGQKIITIESLGTPENLSPLQKAFVEHTAFCCGFCTPGMIITSTALLSRNPYPSREEIIEAMDHNLCRCGSYVNIIEAIESFIREQSERSTG